MIGPRTPPMSTRTARRPAATSRTRPAQATAAYMAEPTHMATPAHTATHTGAAGTPAGDACQKATIEVASGPDKGTASTEVVQPDQTRRYTAGEGVVLAYAPTAPPGLRYSVTDVQRGFPPALPAGGSGLRASCSPV